MKEIMKVEKKNFIHILVVTCFIFAIFNLTGCGGQITNAIDHRKLDVQSRMTNTIFIDPLQFEKNPSVYVRITNTSSFQEINFNDALINELKSKGITVVNKASEAGYIVQANVLFIGESKEALTNSGMQAGGLVGLLAGAGSGDWKASAAGSIIGSVVGGVTGAMFSVDTYVGGVDVSIREKSDGVITGKQTARISNGTATSSVTSRDIKTNYQTYRTKIGVSATQTNIDRKEACTVIANQLTKEIAGFF